MSITAIYKIFAEEVASIDFVCRPGCSTCCTRSVTLTTGEGRLILSYLREHGGELPPLPHDARPLRPELTTNGLAEVYLSGREPREEESPWNFGPCFLLCDGLCSVYEVRPFACRSFGSTVNCATTGTAQAPPWFFTLTIVVNQVLEGSDRGGYWGNLADVLAFLTGRKTDDDYRDTGRLLANLPSPGFLILPEERKRVQRFLARIDWQGRV